MARPKKDKAERRTEQINFRLTATDKLAFLKFAQQDNKQPYSLAREIIESYIEERKERATPDEKLIRFSVSVYKEIERLGKHVNGVTKAYHSQPDRPPHPQKMAGMIDKLEGLANGLEKDWPPQLGFAFGYRVGRPNMALVILVNSPVVTEHSAVRICRSLLNFKSGISASSTQSTTIL